MASRRAFDIVPLSCREGAFAINRKGSEAGPAGPRRRVHRARDSPSGYDKDNIDELIERVRRVFLDRLGNRSS